MVSLREYVSKNPINLDEIRLSETDMKKFGFDRAMQSIKDVLLVPLAEKLGCIVWFGPPNTGKSTL